MKKQTNINTLYTEWYDPQAKKNKVHSVNYYSLICVYVPLNSDL